MAPQPTPRYPSPATPVGSARDPGGVSRIRVRRHIAAPPDAVWDALRDISTHPRWMHDALSIRFTSPSVSGVGTTFECDSKLGPLRMTDHMEVTEWVEGRAMGIRHVGAVTGVGRFTLRRRRGGTRFTWTERLRFPWWMGGPIGGLLAKPAFRWVWKRNLARLADLVEGRAGS